ncbi:DUF402 domain-containing protein [Anaerocolumna xylanovorans]|uniref:DUF402 domain-containing protein n=1 Tax=Anaerocolumna xylanovorans DSM 12503 TaxID=1121345 RepID=A0A1M7XWW0_9FIRM|nr:DUF402 domain-containing protein [Anaerocolumna xylanovorans]SHO43087.1 hypothetical protein SAMN02745217_00089 [Anaerocolumna xylanovorans DSM 12503]
MKRRRFTYDEWAGLLKQNFCQQRIDNMHFKGMARLITMEEVKEPVIWNFHNDEILICDNGMKWLAMMPDKEYYVISALLNSKNEITLWYIDMIAESGIDEDGIVYYYDLYLDLVVYPDGKVYTDDMDELEEALKNKDISREQYNLAIDTSNNLRAGLLADRKKLQNISMSCLQEFFMEKTSRRGL